MIAKFFPWYSEITRPQKNALFSAWLGYVFDGFDFMLIFYIMYLIKADLGLTDMEGRIPCHSGLYWATIWRGAIWSAGR
ncbi:putative sialic acid transporter [Salmonella enterica subsp. enterica serovar Poona]|nr:putative sialic acid transporter [Salmonella enterica subsp. enterica serovar Poona]